MRYDGATYRHPVEANTFLLQVTVGCSHNKCSFCTMYQNSPFKISPIEHIKEDLEEIKKYGREVKRINLLNADPFVLSAKKLIEIGELINEVLPEVEVITGYCSVINLKNKSLEDLKRLRELKFNELYIGIESAYDPALKMMNKGFTSSEADEIIGRLVEAGFDWDAIILQGIAGKGKGEISAIETAKFLNKYPPYMISLMSMDVTKGSALEQIKDRGEFVEASELEMLEEEKELLKWLNFEDCFFFGGHNYNLAPINERLENKDKIIKYIDECISRYDNQVLEGNVRRMAMKG